MYFIVDQRCWRPTKEEKEEETRNIQQHASLSLVYNMHGRIKMYNISVYYREILTGPGMWASPPVGMPGNLAGPAAASPADLLEEGGHYSVGICRKAADPRSWRCHCRPSHGSTALRRWPGAARSAQGTTGQTDRRTSLPCTQGTCR